ncbi:MAG TPA: FUSC family protein [Terracidiphilus sp.]|nr:FUSC family protein [Terracidiphilus sp.]
MAASANPPVAVAAGPHFLADLYSFQWSAFSFRLPLVSAAAVAVCLFAGVLMGHPGAGLVAGGGAFTVGFGANQRISDSRLIPMIAAVFATTTAALAGTLAGHRDYWLLIAAAGSALIYGVLSTRHTGLAWVGQQAFIALVVASAFPTGPGPAFARAGLIAAGGIVQFLITSTALCFRHLRRDIVCMSARFLATLRDEDRSLLQAVRRIPVAFPPLPPRQSLVYCLRLLVTILIATEIYRRSGLQSGYWIPMTALLVQKPAFSETLTRGSLRVLGTMAGAWLGSLFIAHVAPRPEILAAITAVFALLAYATNAVNYGLYTAFLTGYIVFLLSLNQIPGSEIAHRRLWCTALGAAIALVIHLDALRRLRASLRVPPSPAEKSA